jgi:hypothetical protein
MSRLKLKVNNCLLNNNEFVKLFNSIFNKIGYNCFIIFQDYLNIKILKFWRPPDGILTPLPMEYRPPYPCYIDPPTYGILTPLPMVYWPPYPWYIDPLTHGILTPLPMVFWPLYPWKIEPPTLDILTPPGLYNNFFSKLSLWASNFLDWLVRIRTSLVQKFWSKDPKNEWVLVIW